MGITIYVLVRLFIGRNENGLRDIYDEYSENYRIEEEFRRDLKKYGEQTQPTDSTCAGSAAGARNGAHPAGGHKPDVQHSQSVSRTSAVNASESTDCPNSVRSKGRFYKTSRACVTCWPGTGMSRQRLACDVVAEDGSTCGSAFDVLISQPGPAEVISFSSPIGGSAGQKCQASIIRQIEYLEGKAGQTGITGWRVLAFQSEKRVGTVFRLPPAMTSTVECTASNKTHRYLVYSERKHRAIAHYLTGVAQDRFVRNPNPAMKAMRDTGKAILLFYPVREKAEPVTIGFALLFRKNNLPFQLRFSVRDPQRAECSHGANRGATNRGRVRRPDAAST